MSAPPARVAPPGALLGMLLVRTLLPLALQASAAVALLLVGHASPWEEAARWWLLGLTVTNVACLVALVALARHEGTPLRDLYGLGGDWRGDAAWAALALVVSVPLAWLPNVLVATWLFGDAEAPVRMAFQPVPPAVAWSLLAVFPVTQGLAELPTYFGYVAPRLAGRTGRAAAFGLCALALAAQHVAMPFLPDLRFVAWRLLMFLPFAAWLAFVLHRRATVLPWLVGAHVLLDAPLPLLLLPGALDR